MITYKFRYSEASRIIARRGMPRLHELDPITGIRLRASRATTTRYERDTPGDLVHIDVKKLGRIPGGGWRIHGRSEAVRGRGIGYDYVYAAVEYHSRLSYAEVLPDEQGSTCAGFLIRAAAFFVGHGISISQVMTDNAFAYRLSAKFAAALKLVGATHILIRPPLPVAEREGL